MYPQTVGLPAGRRNMDRACPSLATVLLFKNGGCPKQGSGGWETMETGNPEAAGDPKTTAGVPSCAEVREICHAKRVWI